MSEVLPDYVVEENVVLEVKRLLVWGCGCLMGR